jgi:hypothetical protein
VAWIWTKGFSQTDLSDAVILIRVTLPTTPTTAICLFTASVHIAFNQPHAAHSWKTNGFSRVTRTAAVGTRSHLGTQFHGALQANEILCNYYWSSNSFCNQYPYILTSFRCSYIIYLGAFKKQLDILSSPKRLQQFLGPSSVLFSAYRDLFPQELSGVGWGMKVTNHLQLVPKLKGSWTISPVLQIR